MQVSEYINKYYESSAVRKPRYNDHTLTLIKEQKVSSAILLNAESGKFVENLFSRDWLPLAKDVFKRNALGIFPNEAAIRSEWLLSLPFGTVKSVLRQLINTILGSIFVAGNYDLKSTNDKVNNVLNDKLKFFGNNFDNFVRHILPYHIAQDFNSYFVFERNIYNKNEYSFSLIDFCDIINIEGGILEYKTKILNEKNELIEAIRIVGNGSQAVIYNSKNDKNESITVVVTMTESTLFDMYAPILGNNTATVDGSTYYLSILDAQFSQAWQVWLHFLWLMNISQVCTFQREVQIVPNCDNVYVYTDSEGISRSSTCKNGYIVCGEEAHTCNACGGSGQKVLALSPASVTTVSIDNAREYSGLDFHKFISPSVEFADSMYNKYATTLEKLEKVCFFDFIGLNQSGVAKELDRSNADLFSSRFATILFDLSKFFLDCVSFAEVGSNSDIKFAYPKAFRYLSDDAIIKDFFTTYKDITDVQVKYIMIKNLGVRLGFDAVQSKLLNLRIETDVLFADDAITKASKLQQNLISREDYLYSVNVVTWFNEYVSKRDKDSVILMPNETIKNELITNYFD